MKVEVTKFPIDIILCILLSLIYIPIKLFNLGILVRIIIGLPFILFIPGYLLIFLIFPNNKLTGGLVVFERIAFSFGLSMAIVPLIGISLYYSPFGLHLESVLLTLSCFILLIGLLAFYRWYKTPPDKRFIITFTYSSVKLKTKSDRLLSIIIALVIIITIITFIFIASSPRRQETSTEFYLLGSTGKTTDYPKNLSRGERANVTIGLINHEQKTMNYTIEIWLINQTLTYNQSMKTNIIVYNELWFINKISVTLHPFIENKEKFWEPQWEYSYNFSINKTGKYALTFLLFTESTQQYTTEENYSNIAAKKISNAHESLYLWLNISE